KDLGSIVHRALELYKGDLEPALQRAIQENAPLYQGDEVRKMLENYLASPLYKSIPKQQKRELAFAVYEKEGRLISGIIDCLGFNADGSLLLVDYKTGKPPVAGEVDKGYAYQLAIYERVARERWGRAQAGKQAPKIAAELHFLQNNTAWNLEKHTEAVDYYGEAIALCEEISHKTKEADFACRQYAEQGLGSSEENAQNAVTALAPCKYCPYNYVCNHK
ncbi:MAG: PD-(D/E)XK nuclease family protein, partial [Phascolarctobacterium sp.]